MGATKNVLIKPDMKVSSNPTVFQKRKKEEEAVELIELGESYGVETPDETLRRRKALARTNVAAELTRTKIHAKAAAQQAMQDTVQHEKQSGQKSKAKNSTTDQKKMVQDADAQKKNASQLKQAQKESMTCEEQAKKLQDQLETLKLKGGGGDSSPGQSSCQAELADYKAKFEKKDGEEQEKVKSAVSEAKASIKKEVEKRLVEQKEHIQKDENAK